MRRPRATEAVSPPLLEHLVDHPIEHAEEAVGGTAFVGILFCLDIREADEVVRAVRVNASTQSRCVVPSISIRLRGILGAITAG